MNSEKEPDTKELEARARLIKRALPAMIFAVFLFAGITDLLKGDPFLVLLCIIGYISSLFLILLFYIKH